MKRKALSIILPTYNERENIIGIIKLISQELKDIDYQVIVVDDDSPDGTGDAVRELFENNPAIEVFIRKGLRGLASAILYGINRAQGEKILVMDTDFNHDPRIIPKMYLLSKDYDIVIGSRFVPGGGMEDKKRYYFSFLYNIFLGILLNSKVRDNLCGYFMVSKKKLEKLNLEDIFCGYGEYFIRLLFYLQKKGCSFLEIPVFYRLRPYGQSKSRFLSMLWHYSVAAIKLRFKGY